MAVSKENSTGILVEMDVGTSTESFQRLIESQKELFYSQIDHLQKIVVTQCRLTGVNPLSQEMAAGALSIKIGKRPRDLLNPKAVKYMQSVFSIKDTISKKESREISALCGVTVTQVREFFAGQRSRVRKLVRLSKEKAGKSIACKPSQDGCSTSSDPATPIDHVSSISVDPKTVEEVPSCLSQEETIPGIDHSDNIFLENIFNLMRKEETFSGQVKLMEWILQIQNSSVLNWFLTKGGLMILATWLSQAALEEQTTVLLIILKVLCHLPLHKALPVHMSAILQTVNKLRFYRTSDISSRARVLLSRWSKLFVKSQVLKKPASVKSPNDAQKEIIQKQRIGEMLGDESWQSKADIPEILALTFESSENCRKSEPPETLKLLSASTDDMNRKFTRSVSSLQTRERRKVLLVEQPGQKTGGRSLQGTRAVQQGRPMSTDDIQKAKMRAIFMQSKYGKTGSSSNEGHQQKTEDPIKSSASRISNLALESKTLVRPKIEEDIKTAVPVSKTSSTLSEALIDPKLSTDHQESSWENFKRDQLSWQTPPEMIINSSWRIGTGERSKEIEVQVERIRREKEIFYHYNQDIPPNPKEPWDLEMGYDDTLTPVIPTEQPPDADVTELLASPDDNKNTADTSATTTATTVSKECEPEHDLELLTVLLKNPELVFALTSGQGGSLSSAETVRLLDMIKASEIGLPGISNGLGGKAGKVEVTSLPSPTPPSDHVMSGWRSEVSNVPFPEPVSAAYSDAAAFPAATSTIPLLEKRPGSMQPQLPITNFTSPQLPTAATPLSQQLAAALQLQSSPQPNPAAVLPERQLPAVTPSLNQHPPTSLQSFPMAGPPPLRPETLGSRPMHNLKPVTVSIVLNPPRERPPMTLPPLPALLPTPPRPQPPLLPEPPHFPAVYPTWPLNAAGNQAPVSDSRSVRQVSATNPHSQVNQNNYNLFPGGLLQPPLLPVPRENEFVGEPELEMWSPENSPVRSPEYQSGRNFPEPRRDYGRNYRPDWSRHRNSGNRGHRHGSRRWRDRRRH